MRPLFISIILLALSTPVMADVYVGMGIGSAFYKADLTSLGRPGSLDAPMVNEDIRIEDNVSAINFNDYFAPWTPRDRKAISHWAIDVDNVTECTAENSKDAHTEARRIREAYPFSTVEVRGVDLDELEEWFREQNEKGFTIGEMEDLSPFFEI